MAGRVLRGAVVGASTLLGKELADELNDAKVGVWDLTLLDGPDAGGQITAAGDEALVIQAVSAEAFAGVDVVFFAGEAATAREYWQATHVAGASVVDLTGALEGMPGVLVRAGFMEGRWVEAGTAPDLATVAVVVAHPMAAVLAVIETKLRPLGLVRLAATRAWMSCISRRLGCCRFNRCRRMCTTRRSRSMCWRRWVVRRRWTWNACDRQLCASRSCWLEDRVCWRFRWCRYRCSTGLGLRCLWR